VILEAKISNPSTGEIDREISTPLTAAQHEALFAHPEIVAGRYPLLCRLTEHRSGAHFAHRELESLIGELEWASTLFAFEHPVKQFFGPFHTLCCIAFCRGHDVQLRSDGL